MTDEEFLKKVDEAKKDPVFMKALDEFIDITTNRVYRLRKGKIEFLE